MRGETAGRPWDVQLPPGHGQKAHHEVIHQFARAVIDDRPVPVPPEQSATVIAMLESLCRSSLAGREEPVDSFPCSSS